MFGQFHDEFRRNLLDHFIGLRILDLYHDTAGIFIDLEQQLALLVLKKNCSLPPPPARLPISRAFPPGLSAGHPAGPSVAVLPEAAGVVL